MRLFEAGIVIFITIFVLTLVGSQVHKISNKPHHTGKEEFEGQDCAAEEVCEDLLEALGQDSIDLTPESPEE